MIAEMWGVYSLLWDKLKMREQVYVYGANYNVFLGVESFLMTLYIALFQY